MNMLTAFRAWLIDGDTTIALTRQGTIITEPVKVGRWRTESDGANEVMRTSVAFGPFPVETEFDGALIARGDVQEAIPFPSMGKVWAGDMFTYNPEIIFTREGLA